MISDNWSVIVFKCKSERAKDVLINLYGFVEGLEGVKDLHFLIRDRVDDEVVFSFRILGEQKEKEIINSKVSFKLRSLMPEEDFVIDPDPGHSLYKYVAWPWREAINERGSEKFTAFCSFLSQLSKIVVNMAKEDYFDSEERVEIAHVMSWMLGCTEYGRLSTKEVQVGYYDRIRDKYHTYLEQQFLEPKEKQQRSKPSHL